MIQEIKTTSPLAEMREIREELSVLYAENADLMKQRLAEVRRQFNMKPPRKTRTHAITTIES